ncbi:MAG: hypothetical protein AAF727_05950 [Pseudomonadota bacterium]
MSFPLHQTDPTQTPFHPTIAETAAFAAYVHAGQTDKAGAPYYLHLARVSRHLVRLFRSVTSVERHAAWLHDVLEDTPNTANDLKRMGYCDEVISVVQALSKPADGSMTYAQWITSIAQGNNQSAMRVKIADLTDNSDPNRLSVLPGDRAASLEKRYKSALEELLTAVNAAPSEEDAEDDELVALSVTLPAMDRWIIEEAAKLADRSTNSFLVEEITDLAYWITGQGNIKGVPLARGRVAENEAFIKAFAASERKHVPIREWVERQKKDRGNS